MVDSACRHHKHNVRKREKHMDKHNRVERVGEIANLEKIVRIATQTANWVVP